MRFLMLDASIDSDFLAGVPLFSKLPRDALRRLAGGAAQRVLARREVLLHKGDFLKSLPLLLEGRLQGIDFTIDGREVGLYFVGVAEACGELALVDRRPVSETVIAIAPSRVLLLPRDLARDAIFSHPASSELLSLRLASRLRELGNQRVVLSVQNPMQRLCAQLLHLIDALSPESEGGLTGAGAKAQTGQVVIENVPTHQEIAIMINASRETVTRGFQQLLAQELFRRDGSRLIVLDYQRLKELAAGQT